MENENIFLAKIQEVGGGLGIYVPKKNIVFEGLNKGDFVQVRITKVESKAEVKNTEE